MDSFPRAATLWLTSLVLFFALHSDAATPSREGLLLWLDASSVGAADGSPVSRWMDDSGNGFDAVAIAGNEPSLQTNGLNGRAVVRFNDKGNAAGMGQFLDTTLTHNANGNSFTVFAVFRSNPSPDTVNWRDSLLQQLDDPVQGTNALGRTILFTEMNERRDLRLFSFASANITPSRQPLRVNEWMLQTLIQTASPNGPGTAPIVGTNILMSMYRNGAPDGTHAVPTNSAPTAGPWRIGDNKPRAGGLNGAIAELLIYSRPLPRAEQAAVERYLAEKYALPLTGVTLTVNTQDAGNIAGNGLSLTEAIHFVNGGGGAGREPSGDELAQVVGDLSTDLRKEIHFQIPTNPPEPVFEPLTANRITEESLLGDTANFYLFDAILGVPEGGFPTITAHNLVIDGTTQARTKLNAFPIGSTNNNARLRLSIDLRNRANTPHALNIHGHDVRVRGLSFMDSQDAQRTSVIFGEGAIGGQVSGCRFGMFLTTTEVYAGFQGVLVRNAGGGQVIGTDGDGVGDVGEANLFVGQAQSVRVENSPDVRVAGNWFGFWPTGALGAQADLNYFAANRSAILASNADFLRVGTDGDGVGDFDEANVIGNMNGAVLTLEGESESSEAVRFSGNKVGRSPLEERADNFRFFVQAGTVSNLLVGSNLDGLSDATEANVIANHTGPLFTYLSPGNIAFRGNAFSANAGPLFQNLENTLQFNLLGSQSIEPVISTESTACKLVGSVPLPPGGTVRRVAIDLYLADPASPANLPQGATFIGTFIEGSTLDLDPIPGRFSFGVSAQLQTKMASGLDGSGFAHWVVTANYSFAEVEGVETSPFSAIHSFPFSLCDPPPPPLVDFRITAILPSLNATTLRWETEATLTYTIESTEDLSIAFQPLATGQSGPEFVDSHAPGMGARFYRVRRE